MSKFKLLYYLVIGGYFFYLLFLIKLSLDEVNQAFLLAGLSPFVIFALFHYAYNKKLRTELLRTSLIIILFYLFYFLISSFNQGVFTRGITLFFIFFFHIIFLSFYIFHNSDLKDIKYTVFSMLLLTVFVVFIPHLSITGSLKFGAFYNILSTKLLTKTTIEAPLIVALLFLLASFDLIFNKKYTALNIGSIVFSVLVLLLFNRRGFIFSSAFALGVYYLFNKIKFFNLFYALTIIMFLPIYWDSVAFIVDDVAGSFLFSSIIVRHDNAELLTANGRSVGWNHILNLFYTASPNYFFGYFGHIPQGFFYIKH
jgi:hypothetical protein